MTLREIDVQTSAPPTLTPVGAYAGKPAIPLTRAVTLIGSRSSANVRLQSSQVSKAHALALIQDGTVIICDLASRTHVLVNGEQLQEAVLNDGDLVRIGR